MFPIGSTIPRDAESFRTALAEGLAPLGLGAGALSFQGEFPQLDQLRIDLTGARFHRGLRTARSGARHVSRWTPSAVASWHIPRSHRLSK